MGIETQTKPFTNKEQVDYIINLVHDEFLETVIMGENEEYLEWAAFAAECVACILMIPVPGPRGGID